MTGGAPAVRRNFRAIKQEPQGLPWGSYLFVCKIFYHIGHLALQDKAKSVQRLRGDGLAMLHPVQDIRGKTMLKNKLIFGYAFG